MTPASLTNSESVIFHVLLKTLARCADHVRGAWLLLQVVACGGTCRGLPRVGRGLVLRYPPHKGIVLGRRLDIGPFCVIEAPPGATLHIGDRTKLTTGVVLSATEAVHIGNDCLIAEWVSVRDAQHQFKAGTPINRQGLDCAPVHIGDDVWLGRAAAVFRGAHLEAGCIVGAGAQVRGQRLERNGIYVGDPLRLLGHRRP